MRSVCGRRAGTAIVHAAPAAISRNATLPTMNATSGDTRGSPNIGIPTQAIHASAGDHATRNRIADRARPISWPSRLTTACRRVRVTRPPGTASTDIRPNTIESNTGRVADRRGELPLTKEPRPIFVAPQRGAQDFQRQASSCFELLGLVGFAHPTATQQADDPDTAPELPVHEARRASSRRVVCRCSANRAGVAGPGECFRSDGQQTRRAQTFGCIGRQVTSASSRRSMTVNAQRRSKSVSGVA